MNLVVADTNVFIILFKSNLLLKVFANTLVNLVIPKQVLDELTNTNGRIIRDYPHLTTLINKIVYGTNHGLPISITVSLTQNLADPTAMLVFKKLENEGELGNGEIGAIAYSIELSGLFLTCDVDALEEFQDLQKASLANQATGENFKDYAKRIFDAGIISKQEYDDIMKATKS